MVAKSCDTGGEKFVVAKIPVLVLQAAGAKQMGT